MDTMFQDGMGHYKDVHSQVVEQDKAVYKVHRDPYGTSVHTCARRMAVACYMADRRRFLEHSMEYCHGVRDDHDTIFLSGQDKEDRLAHCGMSAIPDDHKDVTLYKVSDKWVVLFHMELVGKSPQHHTHNAAHRN